MSYDRALLHVFAESPVVLFVALLVLIEVLLIGEEAVHSNGPELGVIEQTRCFDILPLLGRLSIEHAASLLKGGVTNISLDRPADCQLMAAPVSGDLGQPPLPSLSVASLEAGTSSHVLTAEDRTAQALHSVVNSSSFSKIFFFLQMYMAIVLIH